MPTGSTNWNDDYNRKIAPMCTQTINTTTIIKEWKDQKSIWCQSRKLRNHRPVHTTFIIYRKMVEIMTQHMNASRKSYNWTALITTMIDAENYENQWVLVEDLCFLPLFKWIQNWVCNSLNTIRLLAMLYETFIDRLTNWFII